MRPGGQQIQFSMPRPGRGLIALVVANVVCYVLQLLLLRANQGWVRELYLSPSGVFDSGRIWQPFTSVFLHSERSPFHLVGNMFFLYLFGARLEHWWGTRRFLIAYGIFALGGGAMTLLVGLLSKTAVLAPLLPSFWVSSHLGASGGVIGMTVAWGLTYANEEFHFFLLGRMKGKTFVLIVLAFELLTALSFENTSSTSHFGGMLAAFILCRGLWKPSGWKKMTRRAALLRKKKKIEQELRVIRGGKDGGGNGGSDPSQWN